MAKKVLVFFMTLVSFLTISSGICSNQNNKTHIDESETLFSLTNKIKEYEKLAIDSNLITNHPIYIQFRLFKGNKILESGSLSIDQESKKAMYSKIKSSSDGKETGLVLSLIQSGDASYNEIPLKLSLGYVFEVNTKAETAIHDIGVDNFLRLSLTEPVFLPITNDYTIVLTTSSDFGDVLEFKRKFDLKRKEIESSKKNISAKGSSLETRELGLNE